MVDVNSRENRYAILTLMDIHIAVDIGGTHMRAATYHSDSISPINISRITTQHSGTSPLARLEELISSVWPEGQPVKGIAVAAPGPLDPYRGIIYEAPNIPQWINLPLKDLLQTRFLVPVEVGNDANLAALGEWKYGAGVGHHYLVYLTVSTGIGGGVIVDDRLLMGSRGLAAELGHINVMTEGPLCGCGQRGHLEAVASGTAIAHWVEQQLSEGAESSLKAFTNITALHVSEAANRGDQLAIDALQRAGNFLGIAIAGFLHIFNPTVVIIGGGVSRSGDTLLEPMRAAIQQHVMTPQYIENLTITTAALGDDAGLLGALALARSPQTPG